jgi:hypothetical protein
MAQTGYTPIQLYYSSTTTNVPLAANLAYGELAINITDGKLFYKDNANAIQVIGWKVVPATAGGTGQISYAVGDLIYANTTTTLAKLADVATGNALISGGVNTAPAWGKIGLTTHVSGTLPIANGGTNQTAFTGKSGNVAGLTYFDGTSLVNDSTVTNVGYDTSTNTVRAKNLSVSGVTALNGQTTAGAYGVVDLLGGSASMTRGIVFSQPVAAGANNGQQIALRRDGNSEVISSIKWAFNDLSGGLGNYISINTGLTDQETFKCDSSQNSTFTGGNLVQGTAAKGVNFTANTPASGMTSQLLNWYEEGTFTPQVADAASGGNAASFSGNARYTRIGRQVTIQFNVDNINTTGLTAGNAVYFRNFPFTSASTNNSFGSFYTYRVGGGAGQSASVVMFGSVNYARIFIYTGVSATADTVLKVSDLVSGTSSIYFSLTYFV